MKRSPRLALPLLAAGIGACAPDSPTAPLLAPDTPPVEFAAGYDVAAGLVMAIDDADTRVIPTLGSSAEASAVDAAFAALGDAVEAADASAAQAASAAARASLDALVAADPGTDPVEVAALRLVLDGADALYPPAP